MTDRLSTLLHDEATGLDIPGVPADRILAQGRGLQHRRRATVAVTGAVAAVLVAAVAVTAVTSWRGDNRIEPASPEDTAAYQQLGAWAAGDEVHVGNHVVTVPGVADLRYTSVGVIAFSPAFQRDQASDPVPSRTTLVTPDGEAHPLDHAGLDALTFDPPATDPTAPYIAYSRPTDDPARSELVLLDLRSDEETVAGTEFDTDPFSPGRGVGLFGDQVSYLPGDTPVRLDWRTGERVPFQQHGFVTLAGFGSSAYLAYDTFKDTWQVWSTTSNTRLLQVPLGSTDDDGNVASLSPDGRYLAVSTGDNGVRVYSVETGNSVELGGDRDVGDYGWTPDGHLVGKEYRTQESEVERCDPATGTCTGTGEVLTDALTLVPGARGSAG